MLFCHDICGLGDWGRLFQDKSVFGPLIDDIFAQHGLSCSGIDQCTPGSNAVFRVGKFIVKIFAPEESGIGGENDFITEKFGMERANQLGIKAPKLFASGVMNDKYIFRYLILEFIEGHSLAEISGALSGEERFRIGRGLRAAVAKMDIPCGKFNDHVLFGKTAEDRWEVFSPEFKRDRKEYLKAHGSKAGVYVHGDLNPDNIIIRANGEICIIDFADAMIAPFELELAAIVCDGFKFDPDYLHGFLAAGSKHRDGKAEGGFHALYGGSITGDDRDRQGNKYDKSDLAERLLFGLLIHDYGANIIRDHIGIPCEIHSLGELRDRIIEKLP